MQVTINGERQSLPEGLSVADLLHQLRLNQRRIAIEVNREIVARELYAAHALAEGDEIEIVQFVGGG